MKWLRYSLMGVSALAAGMLLFAGERAIDALLVWGYALLTAAMLLAVILPLARLVRLTRGVVRLSIGLGGILLSGWVCWLLSDGRPVGEFANRLTLKLADTGLYMVYVVMILAVAVVLYGEIRRGLKK